MSGTFKKRVWIISSNRWKSAITEYALNAAVSLHEGGHSVLFSPLEKSPAAGIALERGLETKCFRSFGVRAMFRFRTLRKRFSPHVVITCGGPETTLLGLSCKAEQSQWIRFRGQPANRPSWLESLLYQKFDLMLLPSQKLAQDLNSDCSLNLPNAVVYLGIKQTPLIDLGEYNSERELVILGRLDPVKGHDRFLRIYRIAKETWDGALPFPKLHIVGKEENLRGRDIRRFAERAGLIEGQDFRLTAEWVAQADHIVAHALLGVVPSLGSEWIGRVTEEFLLSGVRVFLSGVGGLEELLFPGAGASYLGLEDQGAAIELVKQIKLAQSESLDIRQVRRNTALSRYSLESMRSSLENVFSRT